jgi:transcriptional regulator NrdR family protein
MKCPACGCTRLDCKDSRPGRANPQDNSIRRRRVCAECGLRFTTHELIDGSADLNVAELTAKVLKRVLWEIAKLEEELIP